MTDRLVIPLRGPETGKRRLSRVLSDAERRRLVMAMFAHVVGVAAKVIEPAHIVVVTPSESAARAARDLGLAVHADREPSLNAALDGARRALRAQGARRLVVLPADLPSLSEADVAALLAAPADAMAIAPDRGRTGTNGLGLPASADLPFSFGPDSFRRHCELARTAGLGIHVVERDGLAFDVDEPADLALLNAAR